MRIRFEVDRCCSPTAIRTSAWADQTPSLFGNAGVGLALTMRGALPGKSRFGASHRHVSLGEGAILRGRVLGNPELARPREIVWLAVGSRSICAIKNSNACYLRCLMTATGSSCWLGRMRDCAFP